MAASFGSPAVMTIVWAAGLKEAFDMSLEQILPWEVLQCCDVVFLTPSTLSPWLPLLG